jgi:hypothetical protein
MPLRRGGGCYIIPDDRIATGKRPGQRGRIACVPLLQPGPGQQRACLRLLPDECHDLVIQGKRLADDRLACPARPADDEDIHRAIPALASSGEPRGARLPSGVLAATAALAIFNDSRVRSPIAARAIAVSSGPASSGVPCGRAVAGRIPS